MIKKYWHHLLYVTSLVYLLHRNVKKSRKLIKIGNIGEENLQFFRKTWGNWSLQESCAYIDFGGGEIFNFLLRCSPEFFWIFAVIMYGRKLIFIFRKLFKIDLETPCIKFQFLFIMPSRSDEVLAALWWIIYSSFEQQLFTKYLKQTLVFVWNSALREKFNFCFSGIFLLVPRKFSFREGD